MKSIIKLEELGLFILGIYFFNQIDYAWWWFLVLILVPDLSMIGYIFGDKIGAVCYNIAHHRGIAVILYLSGVYFSNAEIQLLGVILFSHSAMDRILGYGLKYEKGFKYTHLGEIGK
ncbi:DUF4260 domain-containing protein [Flavobacterium sp. 5]|uniref:DUF4260 domain-containing protein n=1 Tax=Flavobacterium sp. 5 TaxID=2035199 RepID=UPI000C2C9092|nr:DUF4260 domain-containing protein [Flavobacterium sp. 5]PKB16941.1 uncharacterized protein DUF4260 [Flavobacterium sp. 5]